MAKQQTIIYGIDFEVKDTGLKSVQKELQKIKSLSLTDFSKMTGKAPTKELTAELNKVNKAARVAEQALRAAYNPKLNSYNIQTFNKYLQQSGFNAQTLRAELAKAGPAGENAFRSAINSVTKFNTQVKEAHTILNKIGTTLANTIKWNISSSLMNGVTQSIQQAWGFAKNLDSSLNDIRVVTGKSADEMARFAERANAVASNLGKGTTDYTRAALIYAQQGLGDKEVESRTAVTLKAANVTGQSTEAVSEELTAVWNGYKVSAEQAELYVDRLAAVASTTASNLQELSTGMSKVASAAAAMGVGEEQLAAQLSTIISVTKQAPESVGTALRTVYARITDIKAGVEEDGTTLGQYSGKMAQMGINVLDAAGNLRDMGIVMEEIGAKWGTMTREQQVYLAQTMAGQRQYSNLVALFDNFDKYNSALETAQNAEGTLAAQNEIHMESLSAHLQQLTTQTEQMWMHLIDTDGIKDLIDGLTTIVDKVDKLFTSLGGGQAVLKSLGVIAMSLLSGPIAKGLNTTISNIKLVQNQKLENASKAAFAQQHAQYLNQQGRTEQAKLYNQKADFFKKSQGTFSKDQMEQINAHWTAAESAANQQDTAKSKMLKINNRAKFIVPDQTGKSQEQIRAEAKQYYDNMANQIMESNTNFTPVDNEEQINDLKSEIETSKKNIQEAKQKIQELLKNKEELQERLGQANSPFSPYENEQQEEKEREMLAGIQGNVQELKKQINEANSAIEQNKADIQERQSEFTWEPGETLDIFKAENISKDADNELKSLSNRYEGLLSRVAKARQQGIQEGSQEYKQLSNDIKKFSEDAANYAQKSAAEMADGYKAAAQDEKVAGQAAAQARKQVEQQAADAIRQERIQGIMQVVSGFSMLQVSVENLGNSFKNALDTGDWGSFVGAILTSAPMLISSLTQISGGWTKISSLMDMQIGKSAKVVAAKTTEAVSSAANTAANTAQTAAKQASAKAAQHQAAANGEAMAADTAQATSSTANAAANAGEAAAKGAGGVSKFSGALKGLGSMLKTLAPLLAIYATYKAITILGDLQVNHANEIVEANKKIIDSENEKQEQLRKQEDVIKEIEDLNKQYEQGIITKTELKEKTEQLQQKYKDQSDEIQQLIKDYKHLGEAAKEAKKKQAEQLEKSTKEEFTASASTLDKKMSTMHVREGLESWRGTQSARWAGQASIGGGWGDKGYAASTLGKMLENEGLGGYSGLDNVIHLNNARNDQEAFQQLQILQKFVDNATEEQKESDAYKGAQEILDAMKQDIENYKNAAEQHFDALGKKIATQADIDFNKFDNLNDFSVEYKALAEDMRANFKAEHPEKTEEEIEEAVLKAMKEAIGPEAYEKFGEKQQALNKLDKNTNLGEIPNDVKSMIDALDSDQLDAFLHMDLENVESYDSIKEALEKISQLDFSNVDGLTEANLNAAIESYNKLQQILEAVQKGKKLSKKAIQEESGLTKEEIEEWFNQDVGGNYTAKAGKTQAEAEEFLKQKSVEKYRSAYRGTQKTIESNQAFLDAQEDSTVGSSDWQNQNKQAKKGFNWGIDQGFIEEYENSGQYTKKLLDFVSEQRQLYNQLQNSNNKDEYDKVKGQIKIGENSLKVLENNISLMNDPSTRVGNEQAWENIDNFLADAINGNNTVDGKQKNISDWSIATGSSEIQQRITEVNTQYASNKNAADAQNKKAKEQNENNAKAMLDLIQQIDPTKTDFVKNSVYRKHAQSGDLTEEEFNKIVEQYQKLVDKYKNANEDLQKAQEESKEELSKIHEGLFTIDDDVDETLVVKLGQQFQLTAKKSKLLDDALKSNAKKAKDVAEEVQRYNSALSTVIKNYATWQDKLSGSTADKLSVAPQIKDAMGDTLGISEITLSDSFVTTKQNLEDMRLALEGDEKAYKRLQQAAYNDILLHVGLDDTDLNEVQILLENYFKGLDLDVAVGAELDQAALETVLAELIKKGIDTEQQLEAIFAAKGVDLDVVVENGKAEILSYTKAATHELKQQEKSQEELKNLERDRIKNQKELTKFLKDERDIYHQINRLLNDQERTIKRITRNQQDMYGTELLDNLNAESAEYEKQQKLLKSKQKLQQQDLANKRAKLRSSGAEFDANGNVSNYNNLIGNAMNTVNEIISRERGIQETMNQHLLNGGNTSDEVYKDLELKLTEVGREKSQANDYLNDLKTDLSNYEKVKDEAEDVADQLTEISEKQIEINLKKFNMKLEVTLDLSQATKTWNDYKRNVLQHDDVFNPNRALSAQRDNAQRLADIDADSRSLNQVNQQIATAMADNGNLYKTQGQKKKAIEELQKKAIELRKSILDKEDAIKQTYLEQYDIIGEMFEKQKSQYDFINNQLEHNKNMMTLVFGENDYAAQNVYNNKMIENNLKSIESMNNRIKIAEENLQKAKESGNTAVIEAAEQEWQTAIQNRNQLEEQSTQLLKDRYTTAINQIAHQMEQKLTNGKGFNYLDTQWDLMKKQSNLYLDDINSAFAVKNTEYLYNQALNDTKGLKSQQQLKKVMSEQLDILKEKDKLTQYDVDRAGKVLEIEKARIALEQVRNNKTQMRLKRDSQGNYSYQYVADQDNIAKAENDLAKAENDLYNFDKENYEKSLEEAYNATKEYQEKIKALNEEYINATEERRKQIDEEKRLLEAQYSDYILNLSQETEWGKQNLLDSAMMHYSEIMDQETIDFENMSDAQKNKWLEDMVPSINTGIAEMIGKFSENPDSFKNIITEATQAMDKERQNYQDGLKELEKTAGQNYANIKKGIDEVEASEKTLIEDNDTLLKQAKNIVLEMDKTISSLNNQKTKWGQVYSATNRAVRRVYDYIRAIDKAALKKLDQDNSSSGGSSDTPTIPTVNPLTIPTVNPDNSSPPGNGDSLTEKKLKEKEKNLQYLEQQFKIIKENTKGIYYDGKNEKLKDTYAYDYTVVASKRGMGFAMNLVDLAKDFKQWAQHAGLAADTKDTALRYGADKNFIPILSKMTGVKFDTGGYTGDWSSTQGKLAILHQKELVLNKEDTANLLDTIQALRDIYTMNTIQSQITSMLESLNEQAKIQKERVETLKQQKSLQQQVSISASFPGVTNKNEIEAAFNELINKATQATLKNKK